MAADGSVDVARLTLDWLGRDCRRPTSWLRARDLSQIRSFVVDIAPGDPVIVYFDAALHVGTIEPGLYTFDGLYGDERIKCRPVSGCKTFPVSDLPASFRLLRLTGQQTIQRVGACAPYAVLLSQHPDAVAIRAQLSAMSTELLLAMLSPKQWEILCEEYLRDSVGYRSLLVGRGLTLPDVDLVGVDASGRRILAQCKNDPATWDVRHVASWARAMRPVEGDRLYFFNRGGFTGTPEPTVTLVDGAIVSAWLDTQSDYFRRLRLL